MRFHKNKFGHCFFLFPFFPVYRHVQGLPKASAIMRRSAFRGTAGVFTLFLLLGLGAHAQQLARLDVTITDRSGSGIPQARVTLKSSTMGLTRSGSTDLGGSVIFSGLPAGDYELLVEAADFSSSRSVLTLTVGQIASLRSVLGVSTEKEKVEVRERIGGIDTQTSEVSQVIERQNIANLPTVGRDFIDLVLLSSNANIGRSTAVGAQSPFQETVLELSFAGLRETHSTFFGLDGTDYTTSISGVQRVSPSLDWVLEFRVVASPVTTDNGRNLGSVVNTLTKSGTNEIHGSAYEFFRNNQLDAKNSLSAPGFNTLRFNQFGGNIGGPILPEKSFYFLGYEGQRRAESPLYSSFILHCTDTPGCLGPGAPSINQVKKLLGLSPENLGSILQFRDYDKFFGKLTNVLSTRSTLNIGYLFNDERNQHVPGAAPGQGMPSFYRNNPVRDQTLYGNVVHLSGNQWTSESILNFARRTFHLNPVGAGFEPTLIVSNLFDSGGIQGGVHYYNEQHFQV
jgi:Carboxypeptidase regulatory-like domain